MKELKRFAILIADTASGTLLGDARVNLWPVYGQEDGAYDFLWPLVHIEPARDVAHVFNVDWGQGHFYTHPFFYLTKKSMTLPPFHADRDLHDGFLFPLFWWNQATSFHALFPLYGYHGSSDCFWALGGLVGAKGQEGKRDTWAFPLYFSRGRERFYSLPYSYVHDGRTSTRVFLGGLAGTSHADDDTLRGTWLFPLAFWRPGGFFSLPYSGYDDHGRTRHLIAGGLGGWRADTSWLFPLYYADAAREERSRLRERLPVLHV